MTELSNHERRPFKSQERLEWYQINSFLQKIGQAEAELHLAPSDMIHIGGTANFYRCYKIFGPSTVMHFRGTHDMDVVSFNQGKVQQVLDRVKSEVDSSIRGYTMRRSPGLEDKRSIYIELEDRHIPGLSTGFEIDVYESLDESHKGAIKFNERFVKKDQIVLDPPEQLSLPKQRGLVAVPSLRDYFIMKMDIVDFSRSGLRPKDQFDMLVTLKICEEIGYGFDRLVADLVGTSTSQSALEKLRQLELLFTHHRTEIPTIPADYPFMPNQLQFSRAVQVIKQAKTRITALVAQQGRVKR